MRPDDGRRGPSGDVCGAERRAEEHDREDRPPGVPRSMAVTVTTVGATIAPIANPVPYTPWYAPTRSAGASSKLSAQPAALEVISANECAIAATTRIPAASAIGTQSSPRTHPAAAHSPHASAISHPACRITRAAPPTVSVPRLIRTCRSTTASVFTRSRGDTRTSGATVCCTTHSGTATSNNPNWMPKIPVRAVIVRNLASR